MGTTASLPRFDDRDLRIVHALHKGPLEEPHWQSFTELLRGRMNSMSVSLSFRLDKSHGPGVLAVAFAPDMPHAAEVQTGGIQIVTSPPGRAKIPQGEFLDVAQFIDRTNAEHLRFEQDVMLHHQLNFLKVAGIADGSDGIAWLTVGRRERDFDAADVDFLNALVPHVELSLQMFATIDRERSRSRVSGDAVQRLNLCWLKLDAQASIVDFDANAATLLKTSRAFHLSTRGRLTLADRRANDSIRLAITSLSREPNGRARAFHISDEPWLDMLLIRAGDNSLFDVMEPRIIAYIHGETKEQGDRREQLSDLFGLTSKEALLAIALSRGRTIREAASDLGLTEPSAREYTKRIYNKTGTRGQADLVRLILTSVAALA